MLKKRIRLISMILLSVLGVALAGILVFSSVMKKQAGKIPYMSAEECIAYTLGGKPDGRIAVALIKDGNV